MTFVGLAGSGKDTCGEYLTCHHGFQKIAFADSLKDVCASIFGWDRRLLEGDTPESRAWREKVDPWWAARLDIPHFTPRWCLQQMGTEVMRKNFHNDIWLFNVERRIANLPSSTRGVVMTDARFPNEFALVRRLGSKIIRVRRGDEPTWMYAAEAAGKGDPGGELLMRDIYKIHESEWRWCGLPIDGLIENDADLASLYRKAEEWLPKTA